MRILKSNMFIKSMFFTLSWAISCMGISQSSIIEEYSQSYDVNANGKLAISNKYGDVKIKTWTQNSIVIDVEVVAYTNSEAKAQKIFDRIDISFSEKDNLISAKTSINNVSSWNNSKFKINYYVSMPIGNELLLKNKYGDVYIDNLENGLSLELKYGSGNINNVNGKCRFYLDYVDNIRIGDIDGGLELETSYSDIRIGSIDNAMIESKYSELHLGHVNNLSIEGKYDDYKIKSVVNMVYDGKYDDYWIGSVTMLEMDGQYTDIELNELKGNADIALKYGDLEIEDVSSEARRIQVEASYSDVEIAIDNPFHLQFKGQYTDYSFRDNIEINKREKQKNNIYLEGYSGNSNASLELRIDLRYGELELK